MNYHLNINKLLNDIKGPKGLKALTEEITKISTEIKKVSQTVKPQATAKLKQLEGRYQTLIKRLHDAQQDLDVEVSKTITLVKKTAKEAEKNVQNYKKLAQRQKTKLAAAFSKKKASRKAPRKTTTKKAL